MSCRRSSLFLKMMAFCSSEVYYLEGEHDLSEVIPVLKMMAVFSSEVYYLEKEHVLSEVIPVLEDDGVLLFISL
jgi:hypothetical protein